MRIPTLGTLILTLVLLLGPSLAAAAPGDTTWVRTFEDEFINWATPHYGTYTLPAEPADWQKVVLFFHIACPPDPDDCDPWDRLGHVRVVTPDQGDVEIARLVTPYDITIPNGPQTCTWTHNVTPYKSLLQDEVELRLYIESWIGGTDGWLVTIDFAFIEGELADEPYRVVNLWQDDHVEYGNPDDPVTDYLVPLDVVIPADAEKAEVRVFTTGHGQGNTDNCAEFCQKTHSVYADATEFSHTLWRFCYANPCGPQGGTWTFARAGWCPGAAAPPWKVDITSAVTPGEIVTLDYRIEEYENLCRPGNPDCVDGETCADCDYNYTGHTRPHYTIQSQVVFYKPHANVVTVDLTEARAGAGVTLGPNAPNPFTPRTTFAYTLPRPATAEILLYDVAGRLVQDVRRTHATPGTFAFSWDGRDRDGRIVPAGAYFYSVRVDGKTQTRKMIRVR